MKPVNKFALILWIVAAIFLFADVPMILAFQKFAEFYSSHNDVVANYSMAAQAWVGTRSALLGAGQLAGIGVLIELVDQIRWDFLPVEAREQRLSRRRLSRIWWYLRRWPDATND